MLDTIESARLCSYEVLDTIESVGHWVMKCK